MITFDCRKQLFHLATPHSSYLIGLHSGKYVTHLYWGRRLTDIPSGSLYTPGNLAFSPNPDPRNPSYSLDTMPQEYPFAFRTDYRIPAYEVETAEGCFAGELQYERHEILTGKPPLPGLPATYVENHEGAQTLLLHCRDQISGLCIVLSYTVFNSFDAIARSVRFVNDSGRQVVLRRALSASVDLPAAKYEMITLPGAWGRERHVQRTELFQGTCSIESRRGASSHQQNPFLALVTPETGEEHGDAFGFSLVYSGNFLAGAENDQLGSVRIFLGVNPNTFSWSLVSGDSFQTPEAVLVYSAHGLGGMSRIYHRLYRTRLCRGRYRDTPRPVLINNWEATYFQFTQDKLISIANQAKKLGMELMVLDDGWFGHRDDDTSSLGDWVPYRKKLPEGLDGLARQVTAVGLHFGLWMEPEMVSADSNLFRTHPDWVIQIPEKCRSEGRNQLILDLSRDEVCNYIINTVSNVLDQAPISYIKWDMNRHMTEYYSTSLPPQRQKELGHRYMLGLYRILETLTARYPEVLFEGCSGGGGRFDPGMLFYMPQIWTSDNTDAADRIRIQYGTSLVYPVSSMTAHVSAVPNHQTGRVTPLSMRGDVASLGVLGYELDPNTLGDIEQDEIKRQIEQYLKLRRIILSADLYRLASPFEGDEAAFQFLSEDKSVCLIAYFRLRGTISAFPRKLRLHALDHASTYRCLETGQVYGGSELMFSGFPVQGSQASNGFSDFYSHIFTLKPET